MVAIFKLVIRKRVFQNQTISAVRVEAPNKPKDFRKFSLSEVGGAFYKYLADCTRSPIILQHGEPKDAFQPDFQPDSLARQCPGPAESILSRVVLSGLERPSNNALRIDHSGVETMCASEEQRDTFNTKIHHTLNDSPQPHEPFDLGLLNTNSQPTSFSMKSIVLPKHEVNGRARKLLTFQA